MRVALLQPMLILILAGCASFSGDGLIAGKSTAAEVEALMGPPAQRLDHPNGDRVLYFSRLPYGRAMFVASFGSDGVLKSLEQRMAPESFAKVALNSWTKKEVSEWLGPPGLSGRFDRQRRDWWEYRYFMPPNRRVVWLQFSDDGIVREMFDVVDPDEEKDKIGMPGFP